MRHTLCIKVAKWGAQRRSPKISHMLGAPTSRTRTKSGVVFLQSRGAGYTAPANRSDVRRAEARRERRERLEWVNTESSRVVTATRTQARRRRR